MSIAYIVTASYSRLGSTQERASVAVEKLTEAAMRVQLANAPVSWGVDYADDPRNPPWTGVMDEISSAGYRYTELGPYGYYPTEPVSLRSEFAKRELTVVGGFIFELLHEPSRQQAVLETARRTIELLAAVGGRFLVTIDHISSQRMASAGRRGLQVALDSRRQSCLVDNIDRIADLALARGVTPVIHQHAGSHIEFEDELELILSRLEPSRVGVCIDTGHMAYAGIDPVAFYKRHAARVRYFHFKDIDPAIHARVLANGIPFLQAVEQKVFCPIGRGIVDWKALAAVLGQTGYQGPATVEQDIDPTVSLRPIEDARASRAFLRTIGI